MLPPDYAIVLVGLDEGQLRRLPEGIIGMPRTNNPKELAEIYTAADVYVNPSREETYSMTTAEALACGTPAIVYKHTACEETACALGGLAVDFGPEYLLEAIVQTTDNSTLERSCP